MTSPVDSLLRPPARPIHPVLALLLTLFFIGASVGAENPSGLGAWIVDDGGAPEGLVALLSQTGAPTHENLALQGGIRVHILDATGRPVPFAFWRASAEGWAGESGRALADGSFVLRPDPSPQGGGERTYRFDLSVRGLSRTISAKAEAGAGLRLELPGAPPLAAPLPCDIVFVVDSTQSMAGFLARIDLALLSVAEKIAAEPGLKPRFGLVLYRDSGDDYLVKTLDLDADIASLRQALSRASARGGGDLPEDLGAGLRAALASLEGANSPASAAISQASGPGPTGADPGGGGSAGLRLIFALTDSAPALRVGALDSGGARYADALERAGRDGVKIYTIGMGKVELRGELALRQIALYTGAAYLAADPGEGQPPPGAGGFVRGSLEELMARLAIGEARAAKAGIFDPRDPALLLLDRVEAAMAARLVYPEAARARGAAGRTRLELRVGSGGALLGRKITEGSGSAILDRAALELAASVFPIENPAASEVRLSIQVVFRLE